MRRSNKELSKKYSVTPSVATLIRLGLDTGAVKASSVKRISKSNPIGYFELIGLMEDINIFINFEE